VTATPAERTALLFLATIGVLGVGARALSSSDRMERDRPRGPDVAALDAQLAAVDSAIADERRPGARASGGNGRRSRTTRARPERSPAAARVRAAPRERSRRGDGTRAPPNAGPVDVDVADAAALEALPGIGPALAERIVAERVTGGAYGSLEALAQVRGVGPKLLARLSSHVTFSGTPRPTQAGGRRRAPR
jgi:competence protein ComEA